MTDEDDDAAEDPLTALEDLDVEESESDVDADDDRDLDTLFEEEFTEVDTTEVAPSDVWAELDEAGVDTGDVATETPTVRVISKRICHGCRHFADPPDTRCTHEGTDIREQVDVDHFEVVDCPVVAAREDLGETREEYD